MSALSLPLEAVLARHLEIARVSPTPPDLHAERLLSELGRLDLGVDVKRSAAALLGARYHFAAVTLSEMPLGVRAGQLLADLRSSGFLV